MYNTCEDCGLSYDDVYKRTDCPHEAFQMHAMVASGDEVYIATTLEDFHVIQEHFSGRNSRRFHQLAVQTHVHEDNECKGTASGKLVTRKGTTTRCVGA